MITIFKTWCFILLLRKNANCFIPKYCNISTVRTSMQKMQKIQTMQKNLSKRKNDDMESNKIS
jgi:hypothetical protein